MHSKQKILCAVSACYPLIAFAEVSDKIPSISSMLVSSVLIGIGLLFTGRFRWWLNVFLLLYPIGIIGAHWLDWYEMPMREAIIEEQGLIYFAACATESFLVLTGAIVGLVWGFQRSRLNHSHSGNKKSDR